MSFKFSISDDPELPSTPDSRNFGSKFHFGPESSTSTTPGAPPPVSALASAPSLFTTSATPARAASIDDMASSRGGASNMFSAAGPPSHPVRGSRTSKPSGLSRSFRADSIDPEDEDDRDNDAGLQKKPVSNPPKKNVTGTFRLDDLLAASDDDEEDDNDDDQDAEGDDDDQDVYHSGHGYYGGDEFKDPITAAMSKLVERDIDANYNNYSNSETIERSIEVDDDEDMFLSMRHNIDNMEDDEEVVEDLLLATPAATKRMKKEAESLARASRVAPGKQDFQFAQLCKDVYSQLPFATLDSPDINSKGKEIIVKTEEKIMCLYNEGVGPIDDPEKLDSSMAAAAISLVNLWNSCASELPNPEEHDATIGPGQHAEPFRKASWIAHLLLLIHHARFIDEHSNGEPVPLPESLFGWMDSDHNPYASQTQQVLNFRPSPASNSLFWQTIHTVLIRGQVKHAIDLLANAGWEQTQKRLGTYDYTGRILANIKKAVQDTIDMLTECPGSRGNWNVWGSEWSLFRVNARASWERLSRFVEGRNHGFVPHGDPTFDTNSMADMSRRAESQVPWEIFQHLNIIYRIVQGDEGSILQTAQDWLEASVGICGWWDQEIDRRGMLRTSMLNKAGSSQQQSYAERLAAAFHVVVNSEFQLNIQNHCELAAASIFEGNFTAAIGFLRAWSLPIASAVAEIGSLAQWLPKREIRAPKAMDDFDDMDLEVLGMAKQGPDEIDGMKDTTLVMYARELAGVEIIVDDEYGWEMATRVLGRLDSVTLAEETIRELLHDVLDSIDVNSSSSVERIWRILMDLGMTKFAEESAETYADLLSRDSCKYGEALWYYALAHKPNKVREVLNLLIFYSLMHSTVFPPEEDLDNRFESLLVDRSATLEQLAKQDVDAAQLLGRMLSGYATLRKFYETRDSYLSVPVGSARALAIKRQASAALVAVVASADDNIRGGLYDVSRDAVVSEDFLLALLGEALVLINTTAPSDPVLVTADQMDVLLKAIEDLQTVGGRVYDACVEFFNYVLAATPGGLKGSTPADLLHKGGATSGPNGEASNSGASFVIAPSSVIASQLNRSISAASSKAVAGGVAAQLATARRGWDWRVGLRVGMGADEVLRVLRLGISRDLAKLWLQEVDDMAMF
ncbi:Nucleoporin NUP85 [Ceratocystis lukuohia]|uniref:Nuclear pore complex protein Nup85 n=1 Tax=Ceratocystis lukuohia TaxID=2019550 RepID=A0ABR4MN37_9PEZI